MKLKRTQAAVLKAVANQNEPTRIDDLAEIVELSTAGTRRAAYELAEEGLISIDEESRDIFNLTPEGKSYLKNSLPERRLYEAAKNAGADVNAVQMGRVIGKSSLEGSEVDIALSNFARKNYGWVSDGAIELNNNANVVNDPEAKALAAISSDQSVEDSEVVDRLEQRSLVNRNERKISRVKVTPDGEAALMEGIEVTETVDRLTPEMLTSGQWREAAFSAYNVEAEAEAVRGGKEHILRQTANRVKDVLVGMGFQEMEGPHVDADFWINDCLFMPQDHPARTHWDRFALSNPEDIDELPAALVDRVEDAHRNGVGADGEGYHSPWSEDFARHLALRGHTTSLSARHLAGETDLGDLEPPQRFFSVEKVYRNDTLDPTHLLEFFQIEGWVMAEDLSVRDLMGTFTEFYERFGITDLEFKPHYNPYTEPSFELFGTHPETGEIVEVGNSGIFRPEMLEPLGVDADVMAWGLSLERLLMLMYGFKDIRDVHGTLCDLELLRETEVLA